MVMEQQQIEAGSRLVFRLYAPATRLYVQEAIGTSVVLTAEATLALRFASETEAADFAARCIPPAMRQGLIARPAVHSPR